ncbi:MAG: hypothetical protein ACH34X_02455 [Thiolinea sp.]
MIIKLTYFTGIIDRSKISEVDNILRNENIGLSLVDKTGHAQMSLDQLISQIYVTIPPAIVSAIASGLLTNAMYDAIKTSLLEISSNLKGKTLVKISPKNETKEVPANFGVKFEAGENNFDLQFSSELSKELQDKCIEEAFSIIKKEGDAKELTIDLIHRQKNLIGYFNPNTQKWELIDLLDLIKNKRESGDL